MAKIGLNAKLYWRSAGTYGSPTWTEVTLLSDVTVSPTWEEADASARESRIKQVVKTMLALEVTGRMKKKIGDAAYLAFMNAMLSDGTLDLLVLDGDKAVEGNDGWRCDWQVFNANEDQSMSNALYIDVTLKPSITTNPALAVRVGPGGTLTYSTPGTNGGTFA